MKKSGIRTRIDNAEKVFEALRHLGDRDVLVGIPAEDSDREDTPFGNAAIGYLNETGSPAQNIPARPHLQPGVRSVDEKTVTELKTAANAILDGNISKAENALNRAGQIAVNGVQAFITNADFIPLADDTVASRARRGRSGAIRELKNRSAGNEPNNANARPLIDTGKYRQSITYVVRNKRGE
ncbi:hypothetical protein [Morganella morganii]|uniref:hypothetical protein n=1 Tax=Morganella morganii TaxID=582 RepID=UPI000D5941ED|nr:hypothetical protein [Morganella morganii]